MDALKKFIGKGPNAQLVEEATSDMLLRPDWGKNMEVCDVVNGKLDASKEVVKAIRRRTNNNNPKVQYLALVLLEAVIKNGGRRFCRELAACSDLRDDLIKIALGKGKSGSRDALVARDQAKKILANLQAFQRSQEPHVKSLFLWQRVAQEKGVAFDDIEVEDWSTVRGVQGAGVASDPRNYEPESAPQARTAPPQGIPPMPQQGDAQQGAVVPPTISPMVVVGADGQHWLIQLIPPGQRVRGAVQAPPEVQQNVKMPPVQNLLHYFAPPPARERPQVPQHADPRDYGVNQRRNETAEQEEARLTQELGGVQESIELMKEMLNAAVAENRSAEEVGEDDIITVLAEQLRSYQGRVSYVLSSGGGGSMIESLLKWNDELIATMETYANISGQVGIPVDNSGLVPGTQSADGTPSQPQDPEVQRSPADAPLGEASVPAGQGQDEEIFAVFDDQPAAEPVQPQTSTLDEIFGGSTTEAPAAGEPEPAPAVEAQPEVTVNPVSAAGQQQQGGDEDFDFEQFLNNRLQPVS
eukprot:TRINITY_DN439_c1_g2_i1.p1 TRINITY_DN439_c1_g2~~TRINITY_DN439_c1_g2_i1.p1  ORF type:complete len:526 (+),score=147.64 TRINITY_DN439_c1_g2_i1:54-1631(+)